MNDDGGGGVGSRREARERALSLLYEAEAKSLKPGEVLGELPLPPEQFTIELVEGVGEWMTEVDDVFPGEKLDVTKANAFRVADHLKTVTEEGYTAPTPVQEAANPLVLAGRDVQAAAPSAPRTWPALAAVRDNWRRIQGLPYLCNATRLSSPPSKPTRHRSGS